MNLHPTIYALERLAGDLRERACRLDDLARDLKQFAPAIPTPGDFTASLTGEGRDLADNERLALFEMASRRGAAWGHAAHQVRTYQDGLRLAHLLKQIPKQETLALDEHPTRVPTAQEAKL